MSLTIIKPGICDTMQDLGRLGLQHLGINPGGVMDNISARMVNLLCGNDSKEAVLEVYFPAPAVIIDKDCLLVIGGADFDAVVNDKPVPLLQPIWVESGSQLHFRRHLKGQWCYIAVRGGFAITPWRNSYATHLKAAAGGWQGRVLQKGDCIPFRKPVLVDNVKPGGKLILPWRAVPLPDPAPAEEIWIVEGPEWSGLTVESRQLLQQAPFRLLPASDRMAYNVDGPLLATISSEQMVSSAVDYGTLQLLPGGRLMILMADHQTTGGYPRIGQVISAHRHKLAQYAIGSPLQFRVVGQGEAVSLWLQQYRHLEILKFASRFKLESLKLGS